MSAGGTVSQKYSPKIGAQGCVVIDNSSAWRYDSGRSADRAGSQSGRDHDVYTRKNIIANPNCSTAQLVVALKPLHDLAKIKRVVVSTYQSVSGAGKDGMDELFNQTRAVFVADPIETQEVHQAHRLQRHPAYRCIHGRRLHQGRMEGSGRNQEDP